MAHFIRTHNILYSVAKEKVHFLILNFSDLKTIISLKVGMIISMQHYLSFKRIKIDINWRAFDFVATMTFTIDLHVQSVKRLHVNENWFGHFRVALYEGKITSDIKSALK